MELSKDACIRSYCRHNARYREAETKKIRIIGIARIGVACITGFYCISYLSKMRDEKVAW